ncbi:metalloprotease [Entomophthora muscae]|uniref:Metalloprotease n=1 Tax=Entomophthora muscae TaxID=34485 RepID=A0ACC2T6P6_9FUNG|nr:metalloprotease [Entomophthora muscae]
MEVLVGQDLLYSKALAVMDVAVGMQDEPPELRGLSHLCEHMLSTGSGKYPDANEYTWFINSNAGAYNAHTFYERTVYHFSVNSEALAGALDRFSGMFISPRFDRDSIAAEVRAVDSEFSSNLYNDAYRMNMARRAAEGSNHSYNRHFGGNNRTLSLSTGGLRKQLVRFFKAKYSAHRMRLVVIGRDPLNELIEMIVPLFHHVPHVKPTLEPQEQQLQNNPTDIQCSTIKDTNILFLRFKLRTLNVLASMKPHDYVAYILCQSSQGSVLALLKDNMWAINIECSVSETYATFSFFDITLKLTPQGRTKVVQIIEILFQKIKLIKEFGINKEYFNELSVISLMRWIFLQKEKPLDHARAIAASMHLNFPRRQILNYNLPYNYDAQAISQLLKQFSKDNLRDSPANLTEPIYNTGYSYLDISNLAPPSSLERNPTLTLPPRNKFIVDSFFPKRSDLNYSPKQLITNDSGELWALATQSNSPKSIAVVSLISANPTQLSQATILHLMAKIIMESLDEINFHLSSAGYSYHIAANGNRFTIRAKGFQHKLNMLFADILTHAFRVSVERDVFEMFRQAEITRLENLNKEPPSKQALEAFSYALGDTAWTHEEVIVATKGITFQQLNGYMATFFQQSALLIYLQGNINSTDARNFFVDIFSQLKMDIAALPPAPKFRLPASLIPGTSSVHRFPISDEKELHSGLVFYLHIFNEASFRQEALIRLAHFFLEKSFSYQARNVEKLGYKNSAKLHHSHGHGGLKITIQGESDPAYAEQAVERILHRLKIQINAFPPNVFLSSVNALRQSLLVRRTDDREANYNWDRILTSAPSFDKNAVMNITLHTTSQEDLLAFMDQYILHSAPKRTKLSIHAISHAVMNRPDQQALSQCGTLIPDLVAWRSINYTSDN